MQIDSSKLASTGHFADPSYHPLPIVIQAHLSRSHGASKPSVDIGGCILAAHMSSWFRSSRKSASTGTPATARQ